MKHWAMTNKRKLRIIPVCLLILVLLSIISENYREKSFGDSAVSVAETRTDMPISASYMVDRGDGLLFYDSALENSFSEELNEEKFDALPQGRVLLNEDDFLDSSVYGENFASVRRVEVKNMPFTEARNVSVSQLPENAWDIQFALPGIKAREDYTDKDNMLLLFYVRTLVTENENGIGNIQVTVEQNNPPNVKALQVSVTALAGNDWQKVYLPFEAKQGCDYVRFHLGNDIQTIELGGFELINYKKSLGLEDLPTSSLMGNEWSAFKSDASWRDEALKRIEETRKGEINVIVNNSNGNPVENATVDVDMERHEFQWGTVINESILKDGADGDKYRQAVSSLFNGAVTENSLKWNIYEANPDDARRELSAAEALDVKYLRGHTLIWDLDFPNGWENNAAIPQDVFDMLSRGDDNGLDTRIKEHIIETTSDFSSEITDWDVVNEPLDNYTIRSRYGNAVLSDWFGWAREGAPDANLYINERGIIGLRQPYLDRFKIILDVMVRNDVDFDGIGIQSHFGDTMVHPMYFYDAIDQLAAFGKEIKITEFDLGEYISTLSREYEASFVRDIMIAVFSHESVSGFYMWGFWNGSHYAQNAPIFNTDWSLKESGRQYIDLVYNQWFTKETGVTNNDGKYSTRGYYGDYAVSVTVNDQVITEWMSFYKGQNNTIVITI